MLLSEAGCPLQLEVQGQRHLPAQEKADSMSTPLQHRYTGAWAGTAGLAGIRGDCKQMPPPGNSGRRLHFHPPFSSHSWFPNSGITPGQRRDPHPISAQRKKEKILRCLVPRVSRKSLGQKGGNWLEFDLFYSPNIHEVRCLSTENTRSGTP